MGGARVWVEASVWAKALAWMQVSQSASELVFRRTAMCK
jgi:hypothetical protein